MPLNEIICLHLSFHNLTDDKNDFDLSATTRTVIGQYSESSLLPVVRKRFKVDLIAEISRFIANFLKSFVSF